ncbi:MAG: ferredoxin [Fretibacterium sp.]|nr:ferredoxin [Fretibacterium sp.]
MKVSLDQTACIGCGLCVQISPEYFSLNEEAGTAQVQRTEVEDDSVREAQASCPVSCIHLE